MHTIEAMDPTGIKYWRAGRTVPRSAAFPEITSPDRLGIVMGAPTDGLGAGTLVLDAVRAFYTGLPTDAEREEHYPDYYTFQGADEPADYRMLDVFPDHKNVAVPSSATGMLRAVNDRGINILAVPTGSMGTPDLDPIAMRSAERRIDAVYLYGTDGTVPEGNVAIEMPADPVTDWFEAVRSSVPGQNGSHGEPPFQFQQTSIIQRFDEIDLDEAIARIAGIAAD